MTSPQRNAPAPAATGDEGENQNQPVEEGTIPLMLSPISHTVEDGLEEYILPSQTPTPDPGHFVSRLDREPWRISLASMPRTGDDLTCDEVEAYAAEALSVVAFVRSLQLAERQSAYTAELVATR